MNFNDLNLIFSIYMDPLKPQKKTVKDKLDSVHVALFQSPGKTEAWIIILLIILSITLRIPTTPYPVGVDTYKTIWEVKRLMNSGGPLILEHGEWAMRWGVFRPNVIKELLPSRGVKFFYPFTDPFIYQLDYLTLSQSTSLSLIDSMLLLCIISGVLSFK